MQAKTPIQKQGGKFVRLSAKRLEVKRIELQLDENTIAWLDVQYLRLTRSVVEEIEEAIKTAETKEADLDEALQKTIVYMVDNWSFVDYKEEILTAFSKYEDQVVSELGENWKDNLRKVTPEEWLADTGEVLTEELYYLPVCIPALKGCFPSFGQADYFLKMFERIRQLSENPT